MWFSNRLHTDVLVCVLSISSLFQTSNAAIAAVGNISEQETVEQLLSIVNRVYTQNLVLQAGIADIAAAEARLNGARHPLYNPEMEMGAQRTNIDTYTLGVSQTVDWHNKQQAQEKIVETELAQAKMKVVALRLEMATDILNAIGKIGSYQQITALSRQRTQIYERFVNLAQQLHTAGDISQTELELARLSLAESVMQHATNDSDLITAKSQFFELSGFELDDNLKFPVTLPNKLPSVENEVALIQQHPQVQAAHLASQVFRQKMFFAKQDRKPDPTLGITAGREDKENLIAISLSFPLQIRNDYSHQVDVAAAEAIQADREASQVSRTLQSKLKAARDRYSLIGKAWSLWTTKGHKSLANQLELLEVQWKTGEINTTNYLMQLQQILDTQITGVELKEKLWGAWIEYSSVSGQLGQWLRVNAGEK